MEAGRLVWLWSGLGLPAARGVVRLCATRPSLRLTSGSCLVLAGDELGAGLAAPLARLASACRVSFRDASLSAAAARGRPDAVLLAFRAPAAAAAAAASARACGAYAVWLPPPGCKPQREALRLMAAAGVLHFSTQTLELPEGPDGRPTAWAYAAWAGAVWRWLSRGQPAAV